MQNKPNISVMPTICAVEQLILYHNYYSILKNTKVNK